MDFSSAKVPELKSELQKRGLSTAGRKSALLERLQAAADGAAGGTPPADQSAMTDESKASNDSAPASESSAKRKKPSAAAADALTTTGKTIKISTWNVAGFRACVKKGFSKYLQEEDADIVCLNETKCTAAQMGFSPARFGYKTFWNDCKNKAGYAGVGVLSKLKPLDVKHDDLGGVERGGGRILTSEFENFFLVSTYVPNAGEKLKFMANRKKWDDAIRTHLNQLQESKPVIWCGDLNVAINDYDVYDGETNKARKKSAGFADEERANFRRVLADDGFVDVYREFHPDTREDAMTFWSMRQGMRAKRKGWRLDYFVVSPALMPLVTAIDIRSDQLGSDHVPLVLTLQEPSLGGGGQPPEEREAVPTKKRKTEEVKSDDAPVEEEEEDLENPATKPATAKKNNAVALKNLSWDDLTQGIEASWARVLQNEFKKPYFAELQKQVAAAAAREEVFPPRDMIYNAFTFTPFEEVKVVILGQDPYHDDNQAHGLCFSVQKPIKPPPSLKNIFKELQSDVGVKPPSHGYLEAWARQGVLMLNTVLTVKAHNANSHKKFGWLKFTAAALHELHTTRENLVFILWGKQAQKLAKKIDSSKHLILNHVHPSPLSASRGFFGSKPFSQANAYLKKNGLEELDWNF